MKQADRAQFEAKRIVAAMAAVERRQEDLQAEETEAKWAGERERVIAERDVLAAELAQLWPAATAILVSLIDRMEANDRELRSTCGNLPTAETIARGFAPDVGGGPRPLARETKLPAFADRRGVPLWPRPPGSRIPPPIHFTLKEEPPIRYPVDVPPTRRQIV